MSIIEGLEKYDDDDYYNDLYGDDPGPDDSPEFYSPDDGLIEAFRDVAAGELCKLYREAVRCGDSLFVDAVRPAMELAGVLPEDCDKGP